MAVNTNPADPLNPAMTATAPTGVNEERLAEIKLQVLNGTYLTEDRLNAACDVLFGALTQMKSKAAAASEKKASQQLCSC